VRLEVAACGLQRTARRIEARAVFPIGQADPLQAGFRVTDIRIGNQPVRVQVGMHRARHLGGTPGCRFSMRGQLRAAGRKPEGPALVDDKLAGQARRRPGGGGSGGGNGSEAESCEQACEWLHESGDTHSEGAFQ
jgi:hypothetical protein